MIDDITFVDFGRQRLRVLLYYTFGTTVCILYYSVLMKCCYSFRGMYSSICQSRSNKEKEEKNGIWPHNGTVLQKSCAVQELTGLKQNKSPADLLSRSLYGKTSPLIRSPGLWMPRRSSMLPLLLIPLPPHKKARSIQVGAHLRAPYTFAAASYTRFARRSSFAGDKSRRHFLRGVFHSRRRAARLFLRRRRRP